MRSNRSGYSASPAGSSRALDQKPKPKRSKRELNQLLLMVFFVLLPGFRFSGNDRGRCLFMAKDVMRGSSLLHCP